tara:strand:- start:2312 stop:2950 length:639 start_codon:yes stop_codon:yes gene_type:complete
METELLELEQHVSRIFRKQPNTQELENSPAVAVFSKEADVPLTPVELNFYIGKLEEDTDQLVEAINKNIIRRTQEMCQQVAEALVQYGAGSGKAADYIVHISCHEILLDREAGEYSFYGVAFVTERTCEVEVRTVKQQVQLKDAREYALIGEDDTVEFYRDGMLEQTFPLYADLPIDDYITLMDASLAQNFECSSVRTLISEHIKAIQNLIK